MLKIIKTNPLFFIAFLIFLIVGGILLYIIEQGDAILFFSANRYYAVDLFFKYFTKLGEEPVYIFFISLFLFYRFRYAILIPVTGISALGLSYLLKIYFSHDRPFLFFTKIGAIDQINFIEGVGVFKAMTSFPSGHTTSAFAIYGLVAFFFPKNQKLGLLMFSFALLVGISRIYLVQHFFKDVYGGAILGVLIAMIVYWIQARYPVNEKNWFDRSFNTAQPSKKS